MSLEGYESPAKKPKVEISDLDSEEEWTPRAWKDPNAELEDWESDDLEIRYRYVEDEETRKEVIRYHTEFDLKGPYDMDFFPTRFGVWPPGVLPVLADRQPRIYEMMMKSAKFAVDKHNELNGTKFVLDSVKKANWESGFVFYITLDVKDPISGTTKTCKTKVQDDLVDKVYVFSEFFEI